jgi:ABC-type nitrate/sulfonate/bicarbonate transport system permease component
MKPKSRHSKKWWTLGTFGGLIIIWHFGVQISKTSIVPAPVFVITKFFVSFIKPIGQNVLPVHILYSLSRVAVGYFTAMFIGITFGLIIAWFTIPRALFKPIFDLLRPIPPIAWIPLAILWFGVGELPKYFLIFIGGFTSFTLNSYAGATRVDPQLIGAARMLGASKFQVFSKVVLPSTIPYIFTGAQIAISNCWMTVIGAEMVKSYQGVGWIISAASDFGDYLQLFVGMLAIALTGFTIVNLVSLLERRLLRWNIQGQ